jgi:hypothetical protein
VTLTITASSPTVTYGDPVPTIVPSYSGFVNGEGTAVLTAQPTCSTSYTSSSPVSGGPYSTICVGAAAANYAVQYVGGSVTVSKASAKITVTAYAVTYDANAHTATGSATGVKGEALSGLNLASTIHTNAGSYSDTWTFSDTAGNYNGTSGTVADVISIAPTKTALTSTIKPGSNGAVAVTATANVMNIATSPAPVGAVVFTDSFGPLSPTATPSCTASGSVLSCQLTFSVSGPGTHLITAAFTPTANFSGSTASDTNSATITTPTPNNDVFAVGSPVNLAATFTGGWNPTYASAQWTITNTGTNYIFTTLGVVSGSSITGSQTFTAGTSTGTGVYAFTVSFTDGLGGIIIANTLADGSPATIVIYDPSAGFVTGGGWINSPVGAYTANTNLTGKATFGFVSKYQKGATVPSGDTQFQFQAGNFNFHSTAYTWMVISGGLAQYQGTGTVNGVGNYNFMLTARDGSQYGGGAQDGFRIRITDQTGTVVYDNMPAATSTGMTSGNTQALGGGSVIIHSN